MTTHLGMMVMFALLAAVAFAALGGRDDAARWRFGVRLFLGLVAGGYFLGWLLYGTFGRA